MNTHINYFKQYPHPRCAFAYEWFKYYDRYAKVQRGKIINTGNLFQEFCNQYGIKGSFLDMCRYERMQCNKCQ